MQVLRRHARRAATLAARGSNQARCLSSAPGVIVPAVRDGLVGAIGNTPLIRLRGVSEATGCNILGKAEFMNPGGSVKDRAALGLIEAAEKDGTAPALRVAAPGRRLRNLREVPTHSRCGEGWWYPHMR